MCPLPEARFSHGCCPVHLMIHAKKIGCTQLMTNPEKIASQVCLCVANQVDDDAMVLHIYSTPKAYMVRMMIVFLGTRSCSQPSRRR